MYSKKDHGNLIQPCKTMIENAPNKFKKQVEAKINESAGQE